ncbi:hypothetical protein [Anaerotruncus colihominis]|uniref:hypothetical protein n=1 Tax=Anaerotruncus colihominis TaxID=169435 RepID=UPI002941E6D1|nr:hypothetical protein [Anaerotruncus colihominis]
MSAPFWKPVRCHGYLKPTQDGRIIELLKDGDGRVIGAQYLGIGEDVPDSCDCEGALEFLKTYYAAVEKEFTGVLVGWREVVESAWLYADTDYRYDGSEFIHCGKQVRDRELCGIVYFRSGQKRYVPLRFIEEIEERS